MGLKIKLWLCFDTPYQGLAMYGEGYQIALSHYGPIFIMVTSMTGYGYG